MEGRLTALYTKGAAGSRCLAVRITNSKEISWVMLSFLINTNGGYRESEGTGKEEENLVCMSALTRTSTTFLCFLTLVVLGRVGAVQQFIATA